jgi:hypothetical protein
MAVRLTKKELENKKQIASIMYMAFEDNKIIAETTGVTAKTIGDWAELGKWKSKRSAGTITRDELVNKLLSNINKMLDDAMEEDADTNFASLSDQLIKMTNAVEKLDKKNNIIYNIETFITFNKWLQQRLVGDGKLTLENTKLINEYQNLFINERMANNG